ncbi:MAG TPA: hypothetical protein VF230_07750 [Acidimicrobiales bacterium]
MNGRRVSVAVAVVGVVAAAGYLLVYLYRWEWHRALVAGVLMIALEVGIGFSLVLDRMRRLEDRLTVTARESHDAVRGALEDTRPAPTEPFAWLSDASDRMSVFVPILLGAGVVLSALAWAVERLARATARPTLERGLALRLQPVTVTSGTLRGGATLALPGLPAPPRPTWRWAVVVAAIVPLALVAAGVDRLADATQNRPDALVPMSAGRVVIQIENRQAPAADVASAKALWGACSNQIGSRYALTGVEALNGGRVELRMRPAIGKYAERRLRGCLEDSVMDLVRAEVLVVAAR